MPFPKADEAGLCHARPPPSGGHGGDDAVGGVGQVGEAVGQAGAGQDEVVGVFGFGEAELGQQVQVVAQGLQFGVGLSGQVVAGMGGRSVLHGGVLPLASYVACLLGLHGLGSQTLQRHCFKPLPSLTICSETWTAGEPYERDI